MTILELAVAAAILAPCGAALAYRRKALRLEKAGDDRHAALEQACANRYRALAENVGEALARHDQDGRPTYVNAAWEHLAATTAGADLEATRRRAMVEGRTCRIEFCLDGDAGEDWHELRATPEFGPTGAVVGVLSVTRDISDTRRLQSRLREQTFMHETLLNALQSAGIQMLTLENGRIVHVGDRQLAHRLQWTDAEIDACPSMMDIIHPDDRARVAEYHRRRLAGEPVPSRYEIALLSRSGERIDFEVAVAAMPDTEPPRIITLSWEIGERKRLERDLAARARDFRAIAENSRDLIFRYDLDCRRTYVNPAACRLLRKTSEMLLGATAEDNTLLREKQRYLEAIQRVVATGGIVRTAMTYGLDDGPADFDVQLIPDLDARGNVLSVFAVARDVTALRDAERRAGEFFANAPGFVFTMRRDNAGRTSLPFVTAGLVEKLGIAAEAVRDDIAPLRALYPPADAARVQAAFAESAAHLTPVAVQFRVRSPQGREYWLESRATPRQLADGEIHWQGIAFDITDNKLMESALLASKAQSRERGALLQAVLESSPDIIVFALDCDYRYLAFNEKHRQAMRQLWGREIAVGTNLLDAIGDHPDRATARHRFERALAGESFVTEEAWGDGETAGGRWQTYWSPIPGENGTPVGLTCFVLNVSERQRMADLVARERATLRAFFDALPALAWMKDVEGRYLACNPVFEDFFGFPEADICGNTDFDYVDAELASFFRRKDAEAITAGRPCVNEEQIVFASDGRHATVETVKAPVRDAAGKVIGVIGVAHEITERKRMEDALRYSEKLMRTVIDATPDWIYIKDGEHRYRLVNQGYADALRLAHADILGKDDLELGFAEEQVKGNPAKGIRGFWADDRQVLDSNETHIYAEDPFTIDGAEHTFHTIKIPLRDDAGKAWGVLAFARDVTESKAAESARESALAEAQHLARLRSAFMAQMSHELRTPLNAILGFAQLMAKHGEMPANVRQWVGTIRDNGEHLLALINQVLDFAKIEAGKLTLDVDYLCLGSLLDMVSATIRVAAEKKQLVFEPVLAAGLPEFVRGDLLRLRQILLNLLGNAVKFTQTGRVTLFVSQPIPGRLRFEVGDTGPGIAAAKLESIFQPFEQLAESGRVAEGTGLGLAISRKLAQMMGGEITVDSRPGEGSTFILELDMEAMPALGKTEDDCQAAKLAAAAALAVGTSLPDMEGMPSRQELESLLEEARHGYLRRIARRANELQASHAAFAADLGRLAGDYRPKELVDYLQHCLERQARPEEYAG